MPEDFEPDDSLEFADLTENEFDVFIDNKPTADAFSPFHSQDIESDLHMEQRVR